MKTKHLIGPVFIVSVLILCPANLCAENIDPNEDDSQYAYGENAGWLNFEPSQGDGTQVSQTQLTGYVWAENIGWINLSPASYGGVLNDGGGNLYGYAWGENVGWINFDPNVPGDTNHYGVTIDAEGNFDGWAWGENIGWIHFQSTSPVAYKVIVCRVRFDDLENFCDDWLQIGAGLPGDLSGNNDVNFVDYGIFADYWLGYCPDAWPLK